MTIANSFHVWVLSFFLTLGVVNVVGAENPAGKPDIVLIIADDVGYSDFGCYGGEIPTPNIDKIARNGIRFTNYYTECMCAPSRASLLTGQYHIHGFTNGKNVTIPQALASSGYRTYAVGKWHNTDEEILDRQAPLKRGFHHFYGTPIGCGSYYAPIALTRDGKPAEKDYEENKDFYYTDAITDNAVEYIRKAPEGTPLFLYTAYTAPHWPLHARPEDIAKHKGRYAMGWDKLREQRLERMKKLGIVPPDMPLSPRYPEVPVWEDEENKEWQQRRMEVYAAQIEVMDTGVGRIIKALEDTGRLENTLLLMMVDNGGCHVEYTERRTGPFLNKATRSGAPIKPGNIPGLMPGPEDTWQSYGHGWANVSNTPFRLFKLYEHEGGVHVPLIVQWPAVIKEGGQINRDLAHVIDILPTALDAAGVTYPDTFGGQTLRPSDGKSLVPIFRGQQREPHDVLYWQFMHCGAIRKDNWKLVKMKRKVPKGAKDPKIKKKVQWELYDLEKDPVELNDLAKVHPEKVEELSKLWEEWLSKGLYPKYK